MKIATAFPKTILTNDDLAKEFANWDPQIAFKNTGVWSRYVARDELVSDLAVDAAEKLFAESGIDRSEVGFLLLGTQSPDYIIPATACIVHRRLGLSKHCGALDYNLGCTAFAYGLSLAKGLLASGSAAKVLFIVSDTCTKHLNKMDKSLRIVLGDAAAAVLLDMEDSEKIGRFVLGTDGNGWDRLCIQAGGMAIPRSEETRKEVVDFQGNVGSQEDMFMDGPALYFFTRDTIPPAVEEVLEKNDLQMDEIDFFVFHQANKTILENLRDAIGIPNDKFYMNLADKGNTSGATIPIALADLEETGRLKPGMRVLLAGFGIGLSWSCAVIKW